jgi:hypothetical protein
MQQSLVYKRKPSVLGVAIMIAGDVSMPVYRAWRSVWLAYLRLRHRGHLV